MKKQKQLPKAITIGACELDVPSGIVVDGDRSTKLLPKSVDVLIHLVEHSDQLVTHDQLMKSVWSDQFVTESQITKRIAEIRQALGDNQKPHRYIETLPKRGYRLVCQCEIVEASTASNQANDSRARRQWLPSLASNGPMLGVAIGVLVIALGYFVYTSRFAEEPLLDDLLAAGCTDKSVAVLPFDDLSPDRDKRWYSDGLSEQIINSLYQLPELRVSASTSSFQFRDENIGIPEIAIQLDVCYVLDGSVRRDGDQVRISVQLIHAEDDYQLWADSYGGLAKDIFDVQEDVAESVAMALNIFLDDERRERMFQLGTRNVEAYEAYLQGVDIHTKAIPNLSYDGTWTLWDANEFFERAMELDPDFAAPILMHHVAFADVVSRGNDIPRLRGDKNPMLTPEEALERALADLDKAIDIARNPALKLVAEFNREYYSPTWLRMPELITRLRELIASNQWNWTGRSWVDEILVVMGEHELIRAWAEESLRGDPPGTGTSALVWQLIVNAEFVAGNFNEMLDLISRRRVFGASTGTGKLREFNMLAIQGNTKEAISLQEEILEIFYPGSLGLTFNDAYLAAIQGDYDKANQWGTEIEELQGSSRPGIWLLRIYHETGEKKRTRALIKKIDDWPAGSTMFANVIYDFGYSLPFDLADAPKFSKQLQQAGLNLESFSILPRLSKLGETTP